MAGTNRTRAIFSLLVLMLLSVARSAFGQPVAIPRGHEEEIAVMLGRGESLAGGCRWAGAEIGPSAVRARYTCGSGPAVALRLSLPGTGPAGAVAAGRFDVSVDDPAHTALRDAVAARVRGGGSQPMVVRVSTRASTHHIGPFELGRAHVGDDLVRPLWLDLPLALLVVLLLARALRPAGTRSDILCTALAVGALLAIAHYLGRGVPAHTDVLRDLLYARDCVERSRCHALGPESSVNFVRHGTTWLRLPEWVLRLGGTERALRIVVELCHALALVIIVLGARRHGAYRTAPIAALAAGVASLWVTSHPLLWHPSILPLCAALYAMLLLDAIHAPSPLAWIVSGAALGLLLDAHPSSIALVPGFAFVAWARAPRPGLSAPLGLLAMLGALAVPSPLLLMARIAAAAGDRRATLLVLGIIAVMVAGYAVRRRAGSLDVRVATLLGALMHIATLALLAIVSKRTEVRYLTTAIPFAAYLLALWVPPIPAALAGLVAAVLGVSMGRRLYTAGGAVWSIDEARAVSVSAPLRGRSWVDLAGRLQYVEGDGIRAALGLFAPQVRPGDALGPDVILVLRLRRIELPRHPPPTWTLVPLLFGDVAVVRALRSYIPLGVTRACVEETCQDVDLGASPSVGPAMHFGPRAYFASPALEALTRRAHEGHRVRLSFAISVPAGGRDHRVSVGRREVWRIDGLTGDVVGTPQPDGSMIIDGSRAGTGTLLVSTTVRGSATPPLIETATDETELTALIRGR